IFAPETLSVGDLFVGAIIPGLLLVFFYILYIMLVGFYRRDLIPDFNTDRTTQTGSIWFNVIKVLMPPLLLIISVLGSILTGAATPTEAAAVGAIGALMIALSKKTLNINILKEVVYSTTQVTSMIFFIFIGAAIFSLVFRGFGGDEVIEEFLLGLADKESGGWFTSMLPEGAFGPVLVVMLVMFFLGFILDFIEITFVVVPIVAPILLTMGVDPVWLGIMIAINLQTSFLTPPFGFALFYLRGVAPDSVKTIDIYKGIIPFILIQLVMIMALAYWPQIATWLPSVVFQ
ncbi:MAG: TRAP transporter large permease subunit, partial [Gammaproteobacteria bacterium]|nr:TRAP transporter large permease subunit [Gammaproteobacteria bacterium]